jgi:hypothetical protein
MFHLLESVLPEFDHYLEIYIISDLQLQFQPQDDLSQVSTLIHTSKEVVLEVNIEKIIICWCFIIRMQVKIGT